MAFQRGTFRVRGDTLEIIPAYEELAVRIELFGDEVEKLYYLNPLTGDVVREVDELMIFPATHYAAGPERMERAIRDIEAELAERLAELERQGKLLEAQRLRMRTTYDIEMMRQVGFCSGIENYSMHIDGRLPGSPPHCLLDYFPDDFLTVIDESHVTIPQIGGMYEGDASRKRMLIDHGFRLPSAADNRPLRFDEFLERVGQMVYLSATPGTWEMEQAQGEFVEQVIRPTGLVDPEVVIKPTKGQIDDLMHEIKLRTERDERVLVTTLTKKMAEDLSDYLLENGIRVRYLHSEVDTLRRVELLRELRKGDYDVLVGINLLREGLDLPEVSLVAILDADKEGFLRSGRSLIQTIGRAARNVSGQVHMYADKITPSMASAIDETNRRRAKQIAHNEAHGISPEPLRKKIHDILDDIYREAEDTENSPGRRRRRRQLSRGKAPVKETRSRSRTAAGTPVPGGDGPRRPGPADPGAQRPDARRRPGVAVRAGGPDPRRGLRPEEGAARDGRRRGEVTGRPRCWPRCASGRDGRRAAPASWAVTSATGRCIDRDVRLPGRGTPPPLVRREAAGAFVVLILGWGAPLDVPTRARRSAAPTGWTRSWPGRSTATARPDGGCRGRGASCCSPRWPPAGFSGVPLGELANRAVAGRAAHRCRGCDRLRVRLAEAPGWPGRFALLDTALGGPAGGAPIRSTRTSVGPGGGLPGRRAGSVSASWPTSWAGAVGTSPAVPPGAGAGRRRRPPGCCASSGRTRPGSGVRDARHARRAGSSRAVERRGRAGRQLGRVGGALGATTTSRT